MSAAPTPPDCVRDHPIRSGTVWILDGETYCAAHAAHAALDALLDAENQSPKTIAEAHSILRAVEALADAAIRRMRRRPEPRSHRTTVLGIDGGEVEVTEGELSPEASLAAQLPVYVDKR